jgi:hypothetical protein
MKKSIPQAGILDHSRGESMENKTVLPSLTPKLDYDPTENTQTENLIINTLIYAKAEGKAQNTLHSIRKSLGQLDKKVNLQDPPAVRKYISVTRATHKTQIILSRGAIYC